MHAASSTCWAHELGATVHLATATKTCDGCPELKPVHASVRLLEAANHVLPSLLTACSYSSTHPGA
jgi:hypothetical protein